MKSIYYLIIQAFIIIGLINVSLTTTWCDSDRSQKSYFYPLIESVGFIRRDSVPIAGTINSSEHNQVMIGWNQVVYIKPHEDHIFKKNELFFVFQKISEVLHNDSSFGFQYQIKGIVKITAMKPQFIQGIIVKSFFPIRKGDLIKPYKKINPYIPISKKVPYIRAHIIETSEEKRMVGEGDVVFIDKGHLQGIRPGNIFKIYEHQEKDFEMSRRSVFVDPSKMYPSGRLLILTTDRETSAGLIVWSKNELLMAHQLDVH
jgi:hypothetical protein